ncbi:hypothetical protein [Peribacillus sp. SCS-155]|uniref:hypothetical protein n=1 Tax=Peribacillus sedimenti TaxID=3115297 RepID=UPI003906AF79
MKLLPDSYRVISAIEQKANQVAGFIAAVSDGVFSAYIPLPRGTVRLQTTGNRVGIAA